MLETRPPVIVVMERHKAPKRHKAAPGVDVSCHSLTGMITINEQKVNLAFPNVLPDHGAAAKHELDSISW